MDVNINMLQKQHVVFITCKGMKIAGALYRYNFLSNRNYGEVLQNDGPAGL